MEDRRGMRKAMRGESLPFLQEPALGRAEVLLAQCQGQARAKGCHQQPAALSLCSFPALSCVL